MRDKARFPQFWDRWLREDERRKKVRKKKKKQVWIEREVLSRAL